MRGSLRWKAASHSAGTPRAGRTWAHTGGAAPSTWASAHATPFAAKLSTKLDNRVMMSVAQDECTTNSRWVAIDIGAKVDQRDCDAILRALVGPTLRGCLGPDSEGSTAARFRGC